MAFTRPRASQINFDVTNISDPLIKLNSGQSGSADKDVGIVIERGDDTNVAILFDESAGEFILVNTSEDGTTSGNVTISSYADLKVATINTATLEIGGIAVTSTAAELNVLGGIPGTLTATELGYVDGVTSAIQTQIDAKAPLAAPAFTGTATFTNTTTDDTILLTTTEDSSTAGPVITLKRNSASPADADYMGQLTFQGENDADQEVVYAKITAKIQDASDGAEDGLLEFANMKAGSNVITARLRSDSLQLLNGTTLVVAGLTYPTADGTDGQFITTDGSGNLSFSDGGLADIAGLAVTDGNIIVGDGANWVAESGATARTSLGLSIGTDVQAYDAGLADIAGLAVTDGNIIVGDGANWVAESGETARTSLGLAIGTDVQAYDAGLADIAGLAVTDGNIIVGDGANWVAESGATARTSLGLAIGTDVQAYDAGLADIAGLATTDGNIIVGSGSNWVAETGATARASLGLTIGTDVSPAGEAVALAIALGG
jgi:hypothetical protein